LQVIVLHIIGGLFGLTAGAVALSAAKGARLHRKSGMVFVYAMLVMSASGALMAARMPEPTSVLAGMLTFYLVITALLTVRRPAPRLRWMEIGAMLFALTIVMAAMAVGMGAFNNPTDQADQPPAGIGFFFGASALLAGLGDVRMLVARALPWTHRIARHLWRMCFALWIAAASFFLGQSDEFPEALRIMPLLCAPVLLVMLLMVYWLVRVLFTQWRPGV
jgi:peptidoglycan/LPS O-acetylase OafA/YrhL